MDAFRVWVQPLGGEYRVSVDGAANATWLLQELSRSFIFKTAAPMTDDRHDALYSFRVPYNGSLPYAAFRRVLVAIPCVRLTMEAVAI
jgi:hypothetical protein